MPSAGADRTAMHVVLPSTIPDANATVCDEHVTIDIEESEESMTWTNVLAGQRSKSSAGSLGTNPASDSSGGGAVAGGRRLLDC